MRLLVFVCLGLAAASAACSSSSSSGAIAVVEAGHEATAPNGCLAVAGNVCQAAPCGAGSVGQQDYFCGTSTDYCCGPLPDGGLDSSDDANVFVDSALFEASVKDAAQDGSTASDASDASASGGDASDANRAAPDGD